MIDFGIKVAIGGAVASSIQFENADNAAEHIAHYPSSILAAQGSKLRQIARRLKDIDD